MQLNKIHRLIQHPVEEDFDTQYLSKVEELARLLEELDGAGHDIISLQLTSIRSKLMYLCSLLDDTIEAIEDSLRR